MSKAAATLERTAVALGEAAVALRRGWTVRLSLGAAAWLAAALFLPLISSVRIDAVAADVYLAFAAVALGFVVGIGGLPVLGFGAFMAIGAFTAALLRVRAGWPFPPAALAGAALACVGGVAAGIGVFRLQRVFIAATTWILAWLAAIFLAAFPGVSGGAQGIIFETPGSFLGLQLTPTVHFELALVLLALAIAGSFQLRRSPVGLGLAAARQRRGDAEALGVRTQRVRLGTFAASAAAAGLAGALSADLAGVADPNAFGVFLSLKLFVAVIVGGAALAVGPGAGIGVIALVFVVGNPLADLLHLEAARFDPALAALLVLVALGLGGEGLAPNLLRLPILARRRAPEAEAASDGAIAAGGASLHATDLRKTFGSVVAVDGVTLELAPARVLALVGPNGSGKTTVLKLIAGSLAADAGRIVLDGRDLTAASLAERVRAGIVRTAQGEAGFPDLTALEHVVLGLGLRARYAGPFRALFATPLARAEAARARAKARALLERFGLGAAVETRAALLGGPDRNLVMIVAAYATGARVLLLDEPSAGGTPEEIARLIRAVELLRGEGRTVLLVEHDLRLVRRLADRVLVLEAGAAIAEGAPDEVAANPLVRRAFLGPARL